MKFPLRSRHTVAVLLIIIAMFIVAIPAFAAPGGTLTSFSLNATGCYVDVTATVQDAGFYAINFWDDGNFRAGAGQDVPAGGSFTVRLTIGGVILQGAAGIGVYLEDAIGLAATDTFDSDGNAQLWSDQVGTDCANAGFTFGAALVAGGGADNCTNPLPAGTPIYSIPGGAPAYYDANPDTYAGFDLPPGNWYVLEFTESFAKVWIACTGNSIYVPIETVIR